MSADDTSRDALVEDAIISHERWRQLMRDYEAVVKERDLLEAERDQALAELGRRK